MLDVPHTTFRQQKRTKKIPSNHTAPRNGILYRLQDKEDSWPQVFVAKTEFNRGQSQIAKANDNIKTITFPQTVRKVLDFAFWDISLRSVILNEGLEVLENAFPNTRIELITLPKTLKETGRYAFAECDSLQQIYVEDGCEVQLSDAGVPNSTEVGPPTETMMGNIKVWDLKRCRELIIPEGIERIGNHWFWGNNFENITIPASVREIGTEAFCGCVGLKKVVFTKDS